MVESVVSNGMSGLDDFFKNIFVRIHIVANAKERGLRPELAQLIEHKRCDLGDRAIVKSEVGHLFDGWDAPGVSRHECLDKAGCAGEVHRSVFKFKAKKFGGRIEKKGLVNGRNH